MTGPFEIGGHLWTDDECPRCCSRMRVTVEPEDSSVSRNCPECEFIVWLDPAVPLSQSSGRES